MHCPNCKNEDWTSDGDITKPVQVMKTQSFSTFILRYRICYQCGHRWLTSEEYYRDVGETVDLFDEPEA